MAGFTKYNINLSWDLYFPTTEVFIEILHEQDSILTEAVLGTKIDTIEYSETDGASWATPSFPIAVSADDTTKWKVTAFTGSYTDGTMILKGKKVI